MKEYQEANDEGAFKMTIKKSIHSGENGLVYNSYEKLKEPIKNLEFSFNPYTEEYKQKMKEL